MAELPDATYFEVKRLCALGDEKADNEEYSITLSHYRAAWAMIPEPKDQWSASIWVLAAIADANFLSDDFAACKEILTKTMHFPEAIGNPFLHLRLGQCQFEISNLERAADELCRAYMAEGYNIFKGEDPKYWLFLKSVLQAPKDGWEDE